ncbi:hypothetical protein C8J37_1124 [Rhizobium sp. PP-WC-1G-195]|nr:hypothetical protein C8J37_1124 [Rhizobium sp. PP-WC-1G-195]
MAKSNLADRVSGLFAQQAEIASLLRADLTKVDQDLRATRSRLVEVRAAPIERAEVLARVRAELNDAADTVRGAATLSGYANNDAGFQHLSRMYLGTPGAPVFAERVLGILAITGDVEAIAERLADEALSGLPALISEEQRDRESSKLTTEIGRLEILREKISRACERAGVDAPRAEDADPAALLAPDGDFSDD